MAPKKRKSSQNLGEGKAKAAKPSDLPATEGDRTEWIHKLTAWHLASIIIQPNVLLMESRSRDIFIFWKLSWGLENDNMLFKIR